MRTACFWGSGGGGGYGPAGGGGMVLGVQSQGPLPQYKITHACENITF